MSGTVNSYKSARKRKKFKGRKSEDSFFMLPHYIMRSQEFGFLSPWAAKLLLELAMQYNGFNNGDFSAAYSQLSKRGWNSPGTLSAAIKELRSNRWVTLTRQGGRNRCSLYALSWWSIDECGGKLDCSAEAVARNDWKKTKAVVTGCSNLPLTATTQPAKLGC